jgi:hypothetical protein
MKQQTCVCCVYRLLCFFLASSQSPWHSLLLIKATAWLTRLHCPNSNVILLRFVSEPLTKWTHQKTASTFQIGTTRFGSVFLRAQMDEEKLCAVISVCGFSPLQRKKHNLSLSDAELRMHWREREETMDSFGCPRLPPYLFCVLIPAGRLGRHTAANSPNYTFLSFFLIKRRNI